MEARVRARAVLPWLAVGLFAVALVRTAWVSDDAYITLRTVDNWLAGLGPRWNPVDRVQVFTHPLWMLGLTAVVGVCGSAYYGSLLLGAVVSLAFLLVLVRRLCREPLTAALLVGALASSRAFVDYSTSGLENPLTHLLLALFVLVLVREDRGQERLSKLFLLTGLLLANRMDALLLVLPALAVAVRGSSPRSVARALVLGLAPFAAWCLFALLYYGSVLPVTAYAKAIDTGLPRGALLRQGLRYLTVSTSRDLVTTALLVAGLGVGLTRARVRPLALGALLSLAYVVWIGGDFMEGRFLTPPLVIAACVLATSLPAPRPRVALGAAVTVLVLAWPGPPPPWASGRDYAFSEGQDGIVDERAFHYPRLGLLSPKRGIPVSDGLGLRERGATVEEPETMFRVQVGVTGFEAGPVGLLIDPILLDPLCVRLPVQKTGRMRPGHMPRRIPEGRVEAAFGDADSLHPGLRGLHDDLVLATRAPLLAEGRLGAILRLATGAHDEEVGRFLAEDYTAPPRVVLEAADWSDPATLNARALPGRVRVICEGGIEVRFAAPVAAEGVVLGLGSGDEYRVAFLRGGVEVASALARVPPKVPKRTLAWRTPVPEGAAGFDALVVERGDDTRDLLWTFGYVGTE